jgi:hypothetical protein
MLSDGTATMDRGEMIFWSLDVIDRQIPEWNAPDAVVRFVPFADFRLAARTYMLRYDSSSPTAEMPVFCFDARDEWPAGAKEHAASFAEFLTGYLAAANRLDTD